MKSASVFTEPLTVGKNLPCMYTLTECGDTVTAGDSIDDET